MPLTGFQPSVPARERPQTHALDRKATGIGSFLYWHVEISHLYCLNISSLYGSTDKAFTDLAVQEGPLFGEVWRLGANVQNTKSLCGPFRNGFLFFCDKNNILETYYKFLDNLEIKNKGSPIGCLNYWYFHRLLHGRSNIWYSQASSWLALRELSEMC
jgi:hypothetical protein